MDVGNATSTVVQERYGNYLNWSVSISVSFSPPKRYCSSAISFLRRTSGNWEGHLQKLKLRTNLI